MNPELRTALQNDFASFLRRSFRSLTGKRLGGDRYLAHLCYQIELFAIGDVSRLLINLPPRHLKTFTASVCATAWILGRAPSTRIMIVSNGEELSKEIMRKILILMRCDWYRATFPAHLAQGHQQILNFGTTAGGGVYSASIHGALTGFGADIIIVDDLHHIDDARDPQKMADDIDLFETVLTSRLDDPRHGRMMIVGHRIDLNDVSGHALSQGGWRHVVLPLVAPRDQVYETAQGPWLRRRAEMLRPEAWDERKVDERKKTYASSGFRNIIPTEPDPWPATDNARKFPHRKIYQNKFATCHVHRSRTGRWSFEQL